MVWCTERELVMAGHLCVEGGKQSPRHSDIWPTTASVAGLFSEDRAASRGTLSYREV